jgi:enterobacterial common antigen flippase
LSTSSAVETDRRGTDSPATAAVRDTRKSSTYTQILRSSAIIGGSTAANVVIGLARTKAMALLLGPAGFGLMGAFTTITDLAKGIAQLGTNSSGVRQIAEAAGCDDAQRIALTTRVLRRVTLLLGVFGALALALLALPVSQLTFGSADHAAAIALLSLVVFLRVVSDGQGALLQGMRRIGDMARVSIVSALAGTVASIVVVYWLRDDGVAVALVALAGASTLASWWYARSLIAEPGRVGGDVVARETRELLRLGAAFMISALMTLGAAYVVRIILIHGLGLDAAGLFQAAWTVGGIYITFVLQAMGADFYPRLVAVANDNAECNRLVNEQAQVSVLMASAGVLATLTLAPWAIALLYRSDFVGATEVLRWLCLGMALRVLAWPLGYVLIAKGKRRLFVGADLLWTAVNIALTWWCVGRFGLVGAGVAFFGSYVIHLGVVYAMCRRLSGFRWSVSNLRLGVAFVGSMALVQAAFYALPHSAATAFGIACTLLAVVGSLVMLRRLVDPALVPKRLSWLLRANRSDR